MPTIASWFQLTIVSEMSDHGDTMRSLLICALISVGCVSEPDAPVVQLVNSSEISPSDWERISNGVLAWHELGFNLVTTDPGIEECPRYWYNGGTIDCVLTIYVGKELLAVNGVEYAGLASRDERIVRLHERLTFVELQTVATHEIGHVLLDTGHLPPDERGVMSAPYAMGDAGGWKPTAADYALACETIGICI